MGVVCSVRVWTSGVGPPGASGHAAPSPWCLAGAPGHPPHTHTPGSVPQVQAILRGWRPGPGQAPQNRPGLVTEAGETWERPRPTVGGSGWAPCQGGRALGRPPSSGNRPPPQASIRWVARKPPPTESPVGTRTRPNAYKVLGPVRGPLVGSPRSQEGGLDVCTCAHTRACIRAHTCTLTRQAVRGHTRMHTTNARGRRAVAVMGRAPPGRALSRAQARRRWRRSCPWWARRCPPGSTGPRCPGTSWS